jgi:hypothetical protein
VNARSLNLTYWITNASFCLMMAGSAVGTGGGGRP